MRNINHVLLTLRQHHAKVGAAILKRMHRITTTQHEDTIRRHAFRQRHDSYLPIKQFIQTTYAAQRAQPPIILAHGESGTTQP